VLLALLSACDGGAQEPAAPSSPTTGGLRVEGTWAARISSPHAAAFYFIATNDGPTEDRIVGATTVDADSVGLYQAAGGGSSSLVPVDAIELPAGGSVNFEPGGFEVVLLGLHGPLREGSSVSIVLEFERAGEVSADAEVRPFVDPATLPAT
jgi:copper(I)-binding protein